VAAQWTPATAVPPAPITYNGPVVVGQDTAAPSEFRFFVNGSVGVRGSAAVVRTGDYSDASHLTFLGTRLRLGQINSRAYSYTGNSIAFIGGFNDGWDVLRLESNGANSVATWTQHGSRIHHTITNDGQPTFSVRPQRVSIGSLDNSGRLYVKMVDRTLDTTGNPASYEGLTLSNEVDTTLFLRSLGGGHAQIGTDLADRYLSFATGAFAERARIDANGNVRIGPPTRAPEPGSLLTVAGNLHVDGIVNAKYQDIAEWVPADEPLAPGTVVVLDPRAENKVMASARPYDTTVAGVVSAQPGVLLGQASAGSVKVATTGRVKVRVDATAGSIRIGDLLVTGNKPGTAMRSQPLQVAGTQMHRPGTVVGKALQGLQSGEGEILVLLSLQ
jgi:hypothetical protein